MTRVVGCWHEQGLVVHDPPAWEPPRVLPVAWAALPTTVGQTGEKVWWWKRRDGLAVAAAVEPHTTGRWLHVSLSRGARLPSWQDVRDVKDLFVGRDRVALQVLPRDAEYVNAHPFCFHLWSGLEDQQVVPEDALPGGGP